MLVLRAFYLKNKAFEYHSSRKMVAPLGWGRLFPRI